MTRAEDLLDEVLQFFNEIDYFSDWKTDLEEDIIKYFKDQKQDAYNDRHPLL